MRTRSLTSMMRSGRRLMRLTAKLVGPQLQQVLTPKPPAAPRKQAAASNPGQLEQVVHVPPGLRRNAPLVVLLHGCDQEPQALADATGWVAAADRLGFVLLMPRQIQANNSHRCFNWYQTGDVSRDQGEAASIRAMVAEVVTRHRCDPSRVFVTGLSAGGAMAACLLAAYPDVFAAGAVVAGLPAGAATGVIAAMTRMAGHGGDLTGAIWANRARALGPKDHAGPWPRVSIWHGSADQVVAPGNAGDLAAQWTALQGLEGPGVATAAPPGVHRHIWQTANGQAMVELCRVDGLGHGYPSATALTPLSVVPPLPVSAVHEIVQFWGLR